MGARKRLSVERNDELKCGEERTTRVAAVGARERLSMGRGYVQVYGVGRAPRGAAVVARERLPVEYGDVRAGSLGGHLEVLQWARANGPVGREDVRIRCSLWETRGAAVVACEWLPMGHADAHVRAGRRAP